MAGPFAGNAVRLTGAMSNGQVASTLTGLLARKRELECGDVAGVPAERLRLPQGAIQAAVLDVLASASASLRPSEVRARVEQRLGRAVSIDTVSSFLSVAARSGEWRVVRTSYGRYQLGGYPARQDQVSAT
jgi:hypothetical protein